MSITRNISISKKNAGADYPRILAAVKGEPNFSAFVVKCVVFWLDSQGKKRGSNGAVAEVDYDELAERVAGKVVERMQLQPPVHVHIAQPQMNLDSVSAQILDNIRNNMTSPKGVR